MTTKLTRTDYGFGVDSPHEWRKDAACGRHPDMDLWISTGGAYADQIGKAAHICRQHCPVLTECGRDAATVDIRRLGSTVTAGVYYASADGVRVAPGVQPADPGHGPWCAMYRGLS